MNEVEQVKQKLLAEQRVALDWKEKWNFQASARPARRAALGPPRRRRKPSLRLAAWPARSPLHCPVPCAVLPWTCARSLLREQNFKLNVMLDMLVLQAMEHEGGGGGGAGGAGQLASAATLGRPLSPPQQAHAAGGLVGVGRQASSRRGEALVEEEYDG